MLPTVLLVLAGPVLSVAVSTQATQPLVEQHPLVEQQAASSSQDGTLEWRFEWRAPGDGELHAWVAGASVPARLVALASDGRELGASDPGGRRTPCLELELQAGAAIELVLTLPAAQRAERLTLAFCQETELTRAAAARVETSARELRKLMRSGDAAAGRGPLVQALEDALELPGSGASSAVARARQRTAADLLRLGELELAEATARAVVAHMEVSRPADHEEHIQALHWLGLALSRGRKLDQALGIQERTLDLAARIHDPTDPFRLSALQGLAITLARRNEILQARRLFEQVLELRVQAHLEDTSGLLTARNNLAAAMAQMGDLYGAIDLWEQVLEGQLGYMAADHPSVQITRHNLAIVLRLLGELQPAREILEEVVRVRQRLLAPDAPQLLDSRAELAGVYRQLGELERAAELQRSILEVREQSLPADHEDLLASREDLAIVLLDLGQEQQASELLENVLAARRRVLGDEDRMLQRARRNLGAARAALGDDQGLESLMIELGAGLRLLPGRMLGRLSPRELEYRVLQAELDLSTLLSAGHADSPIGASRELSVVSFEAVEELRAAALRIYAVTRGASDQVFHDELDRPVREASEALTRLALEGASPQELAVARGRLDTAERRRMQALAQDPGVAPLLAALTPQALAARLDPATALVAFRTYTYYRVPTQGEPPGAGAMHLLAFVLRSDGRIGRVELGPRERLRDAIQEWRAALTVDPLRGNPVSGESTRERERKAGTVVRGLVLDPLESLLDGAQRLVVVPDAELHGIPLDALPQGSGLVGERLTVETRLASWELLSPREPAPEAGALVVLGGASFNVLPELDAGRQLAAAEPGTSRERGLPGAADVLRGSAWERGFAPLPGTLGEARAIAALYEEGEQSPAEPIVLLGKEASREHLLVQAPRARWLHLATHGWFAPESVRSLIDPAPLDQSLSALQRVPREEIVRGTSPMLLCGLALAGANRPPDELGRLEGLLTAAEIAAWDLRRCELAVVSACDTNVGVQRAGQGVASLQMALHTAGVRSVITSLWKVPDEATQELMTDFYRRLWFGGRTKAAALWEAKMRLRAARDPAGQPRYTPRDWAGWVLSGEPE